MVKMILICTAILVMVCASAVLPRHAWAEEDALEAVMDELPPLKGPKKTVGILSFENKSGFQSEIALGSDFSEMLTEALVKSGQFIVVARQELGAIISEQDLAGSDRFAASKTAVKGKLVPAQIIIKGAVTEFDTQTRSSAGGVTVGNLGFGNIGLSGSSANAHVAVIVYIIDTTTGQVLDSQRVEGSAKASGIGMDYAYRWVSLGGSDFKRTPLGKATQIAVANAVEYISGRLADIPWSGSVVKVDGGTVYVNAGKDAGIVAGDTFNVCRESEPLTDPITGAVLGSEKTRIGEIRVNEAEDKYSKASVVQSVSNIERGDLVTE